MTPDELEADAVRKFLNELSQLERAGVELYLDLYALDSVATLLIDRMPPVHRSAFLLAQFRRLEKTTGLDPIKAELERLVAEVRASP